MYNVLLATYLVLSAWKKNPALSKREIGLWAHWSEETEDNNKPLSESEIARMKLFMRTHNAPSYFNLFPEERPPQIDG